jgi:rubrerythrin
MDSLRLKSILSPDQKILDIIAAAYEDEMESTTYYRKLHKLTKDPNDKETLRIICMDEHKHARYFSDIYKKLTGNSIEKKQVSQRPISLSLIEEYEKAMNKAIEAVEFYRRIYFGFANQEIRDILFEVISDEMIMVSKLEHLFHKCKTLFA